MKRSKLKIKCYDVASDEEPHPHCPHGPTLLFYYENEDETNGYYACSAHRDKQSCSFHMLAKNWQAAKSNNKQYDVPIAEAKLVRNRFLSSLVSLTGKCYCHTCNVPFFTEDSNEHASHELVTGLTRDQLADPTSFLRPLSVDKSQAQYFFDTKALAYFKQCFDQLGVNKIICMGAPRLHTYLRTKSKLKSYLLDFDQRFLYFMKDDEYAWYNMCNNWFFDVEQKLHFQAFLKCAQGEKLLIFTDPPFGCRTEPIACTLRQLTKLYNEINQLPHRPLPIFWIFPYYAEHYIRTEMPELEMCDYMVNYTNHESYTDAGQQSREQGSPVRIFTNITLRMLPLPAAEPQYKYCAACERFVFGNNKHCEQCGICPSKNGGLYKHCRQCGKCVKSNYQHCDSCRRCTQVHGHNCADYQANQFCWICLRCGHTEYNCKDWQLFCKRKGLKRTRRRAKQIICLICDKAGHNERHCQWRQKYFDEFSFLGKTELKFRH